MVERLSAKEFFLQMLRGHVDKLGIDFYSGDPESLNIQIRTNSITITIPNGVTLKLTDPAIVKSAKLADLEETMEKPEYQQRNELLFELYGKEVVYKRQPANWLNFKLNNAFASNRYLQERLDGLNAENREHLGRFKQHMGFAIYRILSKKVPYADFEDCLYDMSEEEVLSLLANLSMRSHPTVRFLNRGDRKIIAPYMMELDIK